MKYFFVIFSLFLTMIPTGVWGEMSSTNYTIYADSINTGGNLSTGATYSLQDTAGENGVGTIAGSTYEVDGGYQYMQKGSLSLSVDNSSIALGELSASNVSTASTTISVTTDSATGYTLSVGSFSGTLWNSVEGGSVDAGNQEFGLITSGTDSQVAVDTALSNGLVLASYGSSSNGRQTVVAFKASRSSGTAAGTYSQNIVLSLSANF